MRSIARDDRRPPCTAARASRHAVLLLIALGWLSLAAFAAGNPPRMDPPSPLPDGVAVPSYTPGPMGLHPGDQFVFRASWIGIPAAEARIVLSRDATDPRMLKGEVWVHTTPIVDVFYKLRDYLREEFSRASFAPREIYIKQSENRRNSEYRLGFDRNARLVTAVKRNKKGSATSRYRSDNPSGPVSGAIMALSQPLNVGQKCRFDVFSARSRYVIDFTVAARERISTPLGDFDALRVVPAMVYISDNDARKTARETTLWVSADARHLPLRIETTAFVGKMRADLVQVDGAATAIPTPGITSSTTGYPN